MKPHRQDGAALITVLLLFALITVLASQLITRSQVDIERTRWLVAQAQAYQYALGGEALARQLLWQQQSDLRAEGISISPAPAPLPIYRPDYGQMAVEIIDLQGLVNLNNAAKNGAARLPIARLFNDVLLKPELTQLLIDWIDADSTPLPGGAEDTSYLSTKPPYRTGNRPLSDPSELLALKGMTAEDYRVIKSFLTALPGVLPVNPNTAPVEIFNLLNLGSSGGQIVNFRLSNPPGFLTVDEFLQSDFTAGLNIDPALFTVTSEYFGVKIHVQLDDQQLRLFSRIKLDRNSGNITLLDRTIGEPITINTLDIRQDDTSADSVF